MKLKKLFNNVNVYRDFSIIFILFVIGDVFTTWLNISSATGIESSPLFSGLVNGGIVGFFLFFIVKSTIFSGMMVSMMVMINLDLPKSYFLTRNTISVVSSIVVLSNLLVYFANVSLFETILMW